MKQQQLGKTGVSVSALSLGTWQFGDTTATFNNGNPLSDEEVQAIVKAALDAGINTFDTAEGYASGKSEAALSRALKALNVKRDEIIIMTKVLPSNLKPDALREACLRSLKNLDMEYIDLYQIHWPNWEIPIAEPLKVLQELQKEGKIKHIGVSNFGVVDTKDALSVGVDIVSNQLPYSLLARPIETAGIQKACIDGNVSILAYSPLAQGLLTGRYTKPEDCPDGLSRSRLFKQSRSKMCRHTDTGCEEELFAAIEAVKAIAEREKVPMADLSLAWLLYQPGVASVVVGASKPEHVTRNANALNVKMTDALSQELADATKAVKEKLGTNPDLWGAETRYR
eukprot:m.8060 g.8060  ORF g.8060 m.8060 type:complete len:340 (+) comp6873_c0_seq1:140-1159(+)